MALRSPLADPTYSGFIYQYCEELGKGKFGKVIKAKHGLTQQFVAIKLVEVTSGNASLQEIKTLSKLNHPNVVNYFGYYLYQSGPNCFDSVAIVMEYCSKGNLHGYLAQCTRGSQPIDQLVCCKWYLQLASALQFIHNCSIIHCDIKPDNILISSDNSVKIGDVSIAKTSWGTQMAQSTNPVATSFNFYMTTCAGTAPYLAPEVFAGHQYTQNCDIFSLGLVFWVMAAIPACTSSFNVIPRSRFRGCQAWLGQLLHCNFLSCQELKASELDLEPAVPLHKTLEIELFNKMLQYNSEERATIEEVLEDIGKLKASYFVGDEYL